MLFKSLLDKSGGRRPCSVEVSTNFSLRRLVQPFE